MTIAKHAAEATTNQTLYYYYLDVGKSFQIKMSRERERELESKVRQNPVHAFSPPYSIQYEIVMRILIMFLNVDY